MKEEKDNRELLLGWGPDKRILAFNLPLSKRVAVMKVCDELHAALTIVPPASCKMTLVELVLTAMAGEKLNESSGDDRTAFAGEILVFCGFSSDDLDRFIGAYNASGTARVELKAVLTPINADWTPLRLYEELLKEHKAFRP